MNFDDVAKYLVDAYNHGYYDESVVFNGQTLYSQNANTIDAVYLAYFGQTRAEIEKQDQQMAQEWKTSQEEQRQSALSRREEFIERGHAIISESLWGEWEDCIDIRIDDLYCGRDVENALDIMEVLYYDGDWVAARELFAQAGHSGGSAAVTSSIIETFGNKDFAQSLWN